MVLATLFRSCFGRHARSSDPASRRGAFFLVSRALLPGLLSAHALGAPLIQPLQPVPLIAGPDGAQYFDAGTQACAQEGGCLVTMPHSRLPEVLAAPLRAHLPLAAARMLLPAGSRWMLAAQGPGGPLVQAESLVPRAPRVGDRPKMESIPFDLVARSDRLHVAAMFLIGIVLLLASSAMGLIIRHPAGPVVPGSEEPFIPDSKILPRLVASPAPAGSRTVL